MPKQARNGDALQESVFIQRRPLPGERLSDIPIRLREDVQQEALEAAAKVLRTLKPLPQGALHAIIEAIHSPPENLTPNEAAVAALQEYDEAHPTE